MTLRDNIINLIDDLDLDADHWSDDMIDLVETLCAEDGLDDDVWCADDRRTATYRIMCAVDVSATPAAPVHVAHRWIDVNPRNRCHVTPFFRPTSADGWAQIVDREPTKCARAILSHDRTDWYVTSVDRVSSLSTPDGEDVTVYRVHIVTDTCDSTEFWATVTDMDWDDDADWDGDEE